MENAKLDDASSSSGLWSWTMDLFRSDDKNVQKLNETIHVFSIASGHLYERFLK